MLKGFPPIILFFLASYLLTLRWYERLGSIPALLVGTVAQPLFTALLFSFGVTYFAGLRNPDASFASSGILFGAFTSSAILILVFVAPISLLATIPTQRRIRSQPPKEYYDSLEGFEVLVVIGVVSGLCAALAVGSILLLVSFAVA